MMSRNIVSLFWRVFILCFGVIMIFVCELCRKPQTSSNEHHSHLCLCCLHILCIYLDAEADDGDLVNPFIDDDIVILILLSFQHDLHPFSTLSFLVMPRLLTKNDNSCKKNLLLLAVLLKCMY